MKQLILVLTLGAILLVIPLYSSDTGYNNGLYCKLEGIESAEFPKILNSVYITYNDTMLYGLTDQNFVLYEDNIVQTKDFEVISPSSDSAQKIVDIMFVVDITGSMDDEIGSVALNINKFADKLEENNIDFRVGIVFYEEEPIPKEFGYSLTSNVSEFKTIVSKYGDPTMTTGGIENCFSAIQAVIDNAEFRPATKKVIILITDEDSDDPEQQDTTVNSCIANNIAVFALVNPDTEWNENAPDNYFGDTGIATQTGGKTYDITESFDTILTEISMEVSSRYLVKYQTGNLDLNDISRTIKIQVTDAYNNHIDIDKSYSVIPPVTVVVPQELLNIISTAQRYHAPVVIKTNIEGISTSAEVKLYYKNTDSIQYSVLTMNNVSDKLYSTEIPYSAVEEPGVDFYFTIKDGNNLVTYPKEDPSNQPLNFAVLNNLNPKLQNLKYPSSIMSGTNIDVEIEAIDNTDYISKVVLYYKNKDDLNYQQQEMVKTNNSDKYTYSIPNSYVSNTVLFYVTAYDNSNMSSSLGNVNNPYESILSTSLAGTSRTIGSLVVEANSFTSSGNNILAHGNVSVGNQYAQLFLSEGDLLIDETNKIVKPVGTGKFILNDIYFGNKQVDIPIFQGYAEFNGTGNTPNVDFSINEDIYDLNNNLMNLFPEGDIPLFYGRLDFYDKDIKFNNGSLGFDVFKTLAQNILYLDIGDIVLSQTFGNSTARVSWPRANSPLSDLKISGSNWAISSPEIYADFIQTAIGGSGELKLPFLHKGIGAEFEMVLYSPYLNNIGLSSTVYIPVIVSPVGAPVVVISELGGKLEHIADPKPLRITGSATISDATTKIVSAPVGIYIDLGGEVGGSGSLILLPGTFNFEMASAYVKVLRDYMAMGGNLNVMGIMKLNGDLSYTYSPWEVYGLMTGSVNFPEGSGWGLDGREIADGSAEFLLSETEKYTKTTVTIWHWLNITSKYDIQNNHFYIGTNFENMLQLFVSQQPTGRHVPAALVLKAPSNYDKAVQVNQSAQQVIIKVVSTTTVTPDFNIIFPNNSSYTPDDAAGTSTNADKILYLSGGKESIYAIKNPSIGTYYLSITNKSQLGNYSVDVLYKNRAPEINITSPSQTMSNQTSYQISWSASDYEDDNLDVSLYYSLKNSGHNGILIKDNLSQNDNSYLWSPSDTMLSGYYYIYAKVDDGKNFPVFGYSSGRIKVVNKSALPAPENISATAGDGKIYLTWDNITDTSELMSYKVYFGDYYTSLYQNGIAVGLDTGYTIEGLANGKRYKCTVTSIDTDGIESIYSDEVTVYCNGASPDGPCDLSVLSDSVFLSSSTGYLSDNTKIQVLVKNVGDYGSKYSNLKIYLNEISDTSLICDTDIPPILSSSKKSINLECDLSDKIKSAQRFVAVLDNTRLADYNKKNDAAALPNKSLYSKYDFDQNFDCDIIDIMNIVKRLNITSSNNAYSNKYDLNSDNKIDNDDLDILLSMWNK